MVGLVVGAIVVVVFVVVGKVVVVFVVVVVVVVVVVGGGGGMRFLEGCTHDQKFLLGTAGLCGGGIQAGCLVVFIGSGFHMGIFTVVGGGFGVVVVVVVVDVVVEGFGGG